MNNPTNNTTTTTTNTTQETTMNNTTITTATTTTQTRATKMTKTDNLLKLILLVKQTRDGRLEKSSIMSILGKSRAQSYKIVQEYLLPGDTRPAVFTEVEVKGTKYLCLSKPFL